MNLQQQAQNVAKAGRYGDSMLLHVNPVEMKGLRQSLPITRNPKTGQDEAFLPFLAPILGSLGGSALLTGLGAGGLFGAAGLSSLAAGAVGSGLAQYAVTGDLKKGIMAGLTGYGMGKIAQGASAAAEGAQAAQTATDAATNAAQVNAVGGINSPSVMGLNPSGPGFQIDPTALADPTVAANVASQVGSKATQTGIEAARTGATQIGMDTAANAKIGANLKTAFTNPQGGFAPVQGIQAVGQAAMQPGAYIPAAIGMGGTGIMESQEAFQEMLAKNAAENQERKKRMQEEYEALQQANLPSIGGTPANFYQGGMIEPIIDFDFGLGGYDYNLPITPYTPYDPFTPPYTPPYTPPTPPPPPTGFPGTPNVPGEFFTPGVDPEYGYLSGQISPSFNNQTYDQYTNPFDMAYQGFYAPQFNSSYNINPYSSFDPFTASMPFMSIPQNNPPVPPVQPPILPPPDDGINPPPPPPPFEIPIDGPIDGPLLPPDDPIKVPPPVIQPGGPGPIYQPKPIDFPVGTLPSIGGEDGVTVPKEYDDYINNLIQAQISQIQQPDLSSFVTQDALSSFVPENTMRSDDDINSLISQQLSGIPQTNPRTDDEIQAIVESRLEGFQPPSGTPPRSDQDIQALIDQRLSGLPTYRDDFTSINQRLDELYGRPQFTPYDPSGLQGQIQGLQDQFAGFQPFDPSGLQEQFSGLQNQFANFQPYDPSGLQQQISGLQDQFAGFQPYDPSGLQQQFGGLQDQFGQLQNQFQGMPNFDDFARRSDIVPGFDPSGLQGQISGLQNQFAGFQPFDPSELQNQISSNQQAIQGINMPGAFDPSGLQGQISGLQNQIAGIQPFDSSGLQSQILANQQAISGFQPFDPSGLQGQIGQLQGQFAGLPNFSQFATQSQLPSMPDMSQYALQSQLFNPSGIQNQLAGLQGQFNALPDFSQFAMQSQIPQMPNMNQYALASQIPQMPDMSQYALASQIPQMPNMSNFVTQQGLSNALNPYALQSQIPQQSYVPSYNFGSYPYLGGFKEGGKIEITEQVISDPITIDLVSFIQGETQDKTVVETFIEKYGNEMFTAVREMILQQINPGAQTEGQIEGAGNGGMDDDIPMSVGADKTAAAVSQDEYIIPADVLSQAGDGSSDAGAAKFDKLLDNIRQEKYGKKEQPKQLQKDLRSYMT